jgi:hypothetical protein
LCNDLTLAYLLLVLINEAVNSLLWCEKLLFGNIPSVFLKRASMNILLWVLQVVLALHTAVGAVWKLSNSEQTLPALKALPHGVWLAMIGLELLCSVGLVLPAIKRSAAIFIPIAAVVIAAEMLLFCSLYLSSGDTEYHQIIYWLVVAAICAFIAYGRQVLEPL